MTHTGLTLDIYRNARGYDASNHGISSRHSTVTLVGTIDQFGEFTPSPSDARVFAPTAERPAVALRRLAHSAHLVPVDDKGKPLGDAWFMSGGTFASTPDARLADYFNALGLGRDFYGAVAVHDRVE